MVSSILFIILCSAFATYSMRSNYPSKSPWVLNQIMGARMTNGLYWSLLRDLFHGGFDQLVS